MFTVIAIILGLGLLAFECRVLYACGLPAPRDRQWSYRASFFWTHVEHYAPRLADRRYEKAGREYLEQIARGERV